MLVLDGLTRHFGNKAAVNGVSLTIEDGSFAGIVGSSGAGKSTLLRMINRLSEPSRGRIAYRGTDIASLRGNALLAWRNNCAMIFQQFNLVGRLDVFTNVMMGRLHDCPPWRSHLKLWREADRAIVLSALEDFGIAELAAQRAERLSGGQQQRVAIARAFVQHPAIVLADEPVSSLDPHNTKIVMDALLRINRDYRITVLCNLHAIGIAKRYCSRIVGMAKGKIVFDGPPEALTAAAAQEIYGNGESGENFGTKSESQSLPSHSP